MVEDFLEVLESVESNPLPNKAVDAAKRALLDYLGATLAGEALIREKTGALAHALGAFGGGVRVIGSSRGSDLSTAIFLNGLHSHYAEIDDGVTAGIIHPGTVIFSALLPWAETRNLSGEAFVRGTVMGYEASVRLAEAIQPSHKELGHHATATCGGIGATFGICSMLGLSSEVKKNAISSALVRAGGSLKVLEDKSELKPGNSGHAALTAHTAAALAIAGFSGPVDALIGQNGFLEMMSNTFDASRLFGRFDGNYRIEETYFKPYAACRFCHPAIESAIEIRTRVDLDPAQISSVTVSTYELAITGHEHTEITGISSAKMSIPISVAIALLTGKAGIQEYSHSLLEKPEVISLARKVNVQSRESFTQQFPARSPAEVLIRMKDGSEVKQLVEIPKGQKNVPLSNEELSTKFLELAGFSGMTHSNAEEILHHVWSLPADLPALFPLLGQLRHFE